MPHIQCPQRHLPHRPSPSSVHLTFLIDYFHRLKTSAVPFPRDALLWQWEGVWGDLIMHSTNPHSVSLIFRRYACAAGGPIALCTRCVHATLLAVLALNHTQHFAIITSYSNGLLYAPYMLLYLPPALTVTSWTLHGPFMPPSINDCVGLRLAAALPTPQCLRRPHAAHSTLRARAASWSSGFLSASREYMHLHLSSGCHTAEIMPRTMAESHAAMGQEALFDSIWGLGALPSDAAILQNAFARLEYLHSHDVLRMDVVYGKTDGIIPPQGRTWLKGAWREFKGAGHDGVLFLEEVVAGILGQTRRVGVHSGTRVRSTCILLSLQTLVHHCVADGATHVFLQHPRFTPSTFATYP
ncbi:hypothetical protein DFH09DRAFT_1339106 [Mycena vulgaris]|nr:hypothetical protein DFH09DRAFT_1339106 [Mycena vulgaris]